MVLTLIASLALVAAPDSATSCTARQESFVPVGGIDQWVTIAGESCDKPAVLFVHGGPGNPLSPFSKALYGGWEKDFTIVQWDQRGAGRTFGRNPQTAGSALTLEQMTRDGIEVAEYLQSRLGQRKIILVGGSWGSVLAVHMAKARPDLFQAYVGIGQLVSYPENQGASYERLLEMARAAGDAETVGKVTALGPPPWSNPRNFGILRRATRKYEGNTSQPAPAAWWTPAPLYATPEAEAAYEAGEEYSYLQFVGETGQGMLSTIDLRKLGTEFELPVVLIQGAEDLVTVPSVARGYFETIRAPSKHYILLPATGHDPNPATLAALRKVLDDIAAR